MRRSRTTLAALAVGLAVAGCGSTVSGSAKPANDAGLIDAVPPSAGPTRTDSASPPTGTDTGSDLDFDAAIGDCISLSGPQDSPDTRHSTCGAADSNYKVIGKAASESECVSDADLTYYETRFGAQQGALCLDVDWVIGGCLDISQTIVERIDCGSATSPESVRVTAIKQGTTDLSECPNPDGQGLAHEERNFIVCADSI